MHTTRNAHMRGQAYIAIVDAPAAQYDWEFVWKRATSAAAFDDREEWALMSTDMYKRCTCSYTRRGSGRIVLVVDRVPRSRANMRGALFATNK